MNKRSRIIGGIVVALLPPLMLATYYRLAWGYSPRDVIDSVLWIWAMDTQWSEGYQNQSFDQITLGMTHAEVRSIMGEPLSEHPLGWYYTSGSIYHRRLIVFSEAGRVEGIIKSPYWD